MINRRIIVGITGASGAIYGIRMLLHLKKLGVESHLIISEAGQKTIDIETDYQVEDVEAMADHVYKINDIAAPVASGSFISEGMVVIPCTVKTLSGIVNMYPENLILRTADVVLKEKRKLVLVVRETPLHQGHLKLLSVAAELGAHILPPMPSFYNKPSSINEIVDQTIGKALDYLGVSHNVYTRWEEVECNKNGG